MENVDTAHEVYLSGLKNAHAMETQALSIMQPQLNRLESYPDMSAMLSRHIRETEGQIARLEQILDGINESASGLKDTMLSFTGSMAALAHTVAPDEVLKNSLANFAFENFEIAAYTSLITAAQLSGASSAIPLLEQNLEEERQMAAWIQDNLSAVTQQYVTLRASGQRADI
ncbi:ferritin-like domain-containing protein [Cypionkella sp.]|uniref:ferritin-like domain-containing protein n=1 Tax=Cypionkella sp. TaxID=2811411 RepID=UPI00261A4ACD|nr:ferritin-like domain-containing protein [Cypionkella sp.]MDB5666437.1 hypothetical protein [Cypionkella sp.]